MNKRQLKLSLGNGGAVDDSPLNVDGLTLWLDASDSSTITESGGAVSQWDDKSGSGNNATQGTGSAQPTTNATSQNGKNVIDFDGTTDFMALPSGIFTIPNADNTVFVVVSHDVTEDNDRIINMEDTATSNFSVEYAAAGTMAFQNSTTVGVVTASLTETNFNIITCFLSGTTQSVAVNNGSASTNTSGDTGATIDAAAIGGNASGAGQLLNGSIAEILIYNRALSVAERYSIAQNLSYKWGINLA